MFVEQDKQHQQWISKDLTNKQKQNDKSRKMGPIIQYFSNKHDRTTYHTHDYAGCNAECNYHSSTPNNRRSGMSFNVKNYCYEGNTIKITMQK